jgi:DmsE family decaheme c-type cytochrome
MRMGVTALLLVMASALSQAQAGKLKYADESSCIDCHEKETKTYNASSHGFTGSDKNPASKRGCQTCHGPAQAHVDSGGTGPILDLSTKSKLTASKRSEACLQCHDGGKQENWHGSVHDARGVGCADCHSVHGGNPSNLKFAKQTEVCSQCHKDIRSQLSRLSHHPLREGKMECADCHNPHGTVTAKLVDGNSVNDKCLSCHAEHRGPFLWDHAPVRENCLSCHTPHGSTHSKLLVARMTGLCIRCHQEGGGHMGGTYFRKVPPPAAQVDQSGQNVYQAGVGSRAIGRHCLNCHPAIHGSNHPSGFFFNR